LTEMIWLSINLNHTCLMKLINSITKQEIKVGDIVISFRGEKCEVCSWSEPRHSDSTGRMYVKSEQYNRGNFYPTVFNCKFVWTWQIKFIPTSETVPNAGKSFG
jgi:hypothetical protein